MTFRSFDFDDFIATPSETQARLFPQYRGADTRFDIVIIGSGMGGGLLADALADGNVGKTRRILVLEAGSYLFPTHVYNVCRFSNADVAKKFECKTFWQSNNDDREQFYIGRRPQLNFGGRSVFWSGLIPTVQQWELDFFPENVRRDLANGLLRDAGLTMNESESMGRTAQRIVEELRQTDLDNDFDIRETPRALHQPYLTPEGVPREEYFHEPTGVFNTAELLINQLGLPADYKPDDPGLHVMLNQYVEDIRQKPDDTFELVVRNTLTGEGRLFHAGTVVLAGGSIESPKLLARSTMLHALPADVKPLIGRGLTDHPTSHDVVTLVTRIGEVRIPRKEAHAKIIFYSRGRPDENGRIRYPFNVEMNVNHEFWHQRQNDPGIAPQLTNTDSSIVDVKFSFGNCLDDGNVVRPADPFKYVPEIVFRNQRWTDHLVGSRFPALGWSKSAPEVWDVLNDVTRRIFSKFHNGDAVAQPHARFGHDGKGFGYGTVHHAIGTLRMPWRPTHTSDFNRPSVVDEDLRVAGTRHLYVCDMSVMPFSSAANPVRTLAALALRMAKHFGA